MPKSKPRSRQAGGGKDDNSFVKNQRHQAKHKAENTKTKWVHKKQAKVLIK